MDLFLERFCKDHFGPVPSPDPDEVDEDGFGDGLHEFTPEEWDQYCDEVEKSGGYDVSSFPKVFAIGTIVPIPQPWYPERTEEFNEYAKLALDDYNNKQGTHFEFVKPVKLNEQSARGILHYLTFEARDANDPNGEIKIFQAKVLAQICDLPPRIDECRLKPGVPEDGPEAKKPRLSS